MLGLNPKKPNRLYKEVSDLLKVDVELVKDLLDFYWSELHKALNELRHPFVKVDGLGEFFIHHGKLRYTIDHYKVALSKVDPHKSIGAYEKYQNLEKRIELLNNVLNQIQNQHEKNKKIRAARIAKKNLQKPKTDSGGSN